ncbi:hypothetical protein KY289_019630 [Solanum tuberosum]|nr:hypothetical protein KY289_019630 [Solanum tuberosum]
MVTVIHPIPMAAQLQKNSPPIVQKHFCFSSAQASSALLIKPPMITERKKPLTSISTDDPGLNDIIEEAKSRKPGILSHSSSCSFCDN